MVQRAAVVIVDDLHVEAERHELILQLGQHRLQQQLPLPFEICAHVASLATHARREYRHKIVSNKSSLM